VEPLRVLVELAVAAQVVGIRQVLELLTLVEAVVVVDLTVAY
jgi:hypothetical protein